MTAEQYIREAIEEHECTSAFTLAMTWEELGADSLDVVEIVMIFEARVHKDISKEDSDLLLKTKTVGELVTIVEKYCN